MSAPLTSSKLGSTRCVGCEKRFAEDGRAVVEIEATDRTGGRPGYLGTTYIPVMRRWHTDCHDGQLAFEIESRARAEADRLSTIAQIRKAIEASA